MHHLNPSPIIHDAYHLLRHSLPPPPLNHPLYSASGRRVSRVSFSKVCIPLLRLVQCVILV